MVNYYVEKMTVISLSVIGQLFDTNVVASTDEGC